MMIFTPPDNPLLVSVPHAGTTLSADIAARMTDHVSDLPDTDWHVDRLMEFVPDFGAGLLCATQSRYVIDLNRGRDDQPLYAGPTTGLVPTETFAGAPVYAGSSPDGGEIAERITRYWQPYHDRLASTLEDIRSRHGYAILLDAHSIRSRVPRFFDGRLPDLNLGTHDGRSCDPALQANVENLLANREGFTHVVNGRFKGGYITRHYGCPEDGIHALQLEIAQACYLDESRPRHWDPERARPLRQLLHDLVAYLIKWRPA